MAEYKGIKGFKVQTVSTDPVANQYAGGTWASGGDLNTARAQAGGAGSQTAGLAFGGSGPPYLTATEEYNGSSWATSPGSLSTARAGLGNAGTQTAALGFGGEDTPSTETTATEEYDGSTWTAGGSLSTLRAHFASAGSQTAALCAGGNGASPTSSAVEEYNGTSWTAGTSLPTAVQFNMGLGLQTAAFSITPTATIEYNGTSWTSVTHLNTGRNRGATSGTVTSALVFNGNIPPNTTVTEFYDGTSWTELNDMAVARQDIKSTQTAPSSATVAFGGYSIPATANVATTEEWTVPSVFQQENLGQVYYNSTSNAFKVTQQPVSSGTWASGGNANNSYFGRAGLGVQTSAVAAGGRAPPLSYTTSETYDGTSWTETVDMSTARGNATGFGSSTAGIIAAGLNSTLTASITTVESYNGSAWTAVNSINTARNQLAASGNQTAGIIMGGSPVTGFTESWDGTNWTEVADLNTARQSLGGNGGSSGSQTAALAFGGATPTNTGATESWNGSAWTEVADLNNVRRDLGGVGPQTYGLAYAGEGPGGGTSFTEFWDGTSWTELNDLANALDYIGSAGTSGTSALTIGGRLWPAGSQTNITEEWNVPITNSTLTAS